MLPTVKPKKEKSWLKGITLTSLGWELALPIFLGVLLGYQIDKHLSINYTFTMIFLVLGIITSYINLYRLIELELLRTRISKIRPKKDIESS